MSASATETPVGLIGRRRESAALERVLADARAGTSAVLVLRGEAGIGRTALLDHIAAHAAGFAVAAVAGVESEMELPYASLQQLFASMLDRLPQLPAPQREALSVAFGAQSGPPPDRFTVGLAALSLLGALDEPLLCLVDDAQWIDHASLQALAFVARRLQAEPVALIFAVREPAEPPVLPGLAEMTVSGISDTDARALLASVLRVPLDPQVRDRLVAEAHGNPLALLQVPRSLAPAEPAGGFWHPEGRSATSRLESAYLQQVQSLPQDTRQLLLIAATDPTGDAGLLWRAAEAQDIAAAAAAPAEAAGLIEIGARVRFRQQIVRTAVYRGATMAQRRAAHLALAEATDPELDPDRRAWHRARAATQPDERIAADLEHSAVRAHRRGGAAATATFLRWATDLTPDPARRVPRALAAAEAAFEVGAVDHTHNLLAVAEAGPMDDLLRARLERLRARLVCTQVRGGDAPRLLLDAAARMAPLDAALARDTLLEAVGAAILAGRLGPGELEVARAVRAGPPASEPPRTVDVLLDSVTGRIVDGYGGEVGGLQDAVRTLCREQESEATATVGWLWLACPVTPEPLAPEVWDDDAWHELTTSGADIARKAGTLSVLPLALSYQANYCLHTGDFDTASALIDESIAISEAVGSMPLTYGSLLLSAWRAQQPQALDLIEAGIRQASAQGEGRALALAEYAAALLHNGLGRYEAAQAAAAQACAHEDLGFFGWALVELIEAATRNDDRGTAEAALDRLVPSTRASATAWARGMEARSRGLLADGPAAETHYREAVEQLERCRITVHLARAHLVYGEWLRRQNRRQDSRMQLRAAHDVFTRAGADGFAERARRELTATGETVRKRNVSPLGELTGQEAQIARLARDGHTNPEIAAQLFISPRTVEWHLGNVFTKLGVSSRRYLHAAMPVAEPSEPA
ncbi:helix-turn-helix transcriptional regulator [Catellatospora chokoriensis]|uniref:Helix-turn-helix transcriptional regulator n=1 Tax=Catellatospora chokoriensis TaxID=310353 RepID=A0A8J3NP54_9ACTN|nr:LuxR family transcriptional regulator [Catellatospora chokoriensis]GIF87837.1 helix-turn-helix transcriptional regulator [Catellatospora chokoriensis]